MPAVFVVAVWGAAQLLVWGTAEPLNAVRAGTAGLNELLGLAAALAAWAVLTWVTAVVLCTAVAALPGAVGRIGARVTHRIAPAAARNAARLAVGLAVTAGPVAAAPAAVGAPESVDAVAYSQVIDISELPGVGRPGQPVPPGNAREPGSAATQPDMRGTETASTPQAVRTAEPERAGTEPAPDAGLVTEPAREAGPGDEVIVQRGDSLWAIAARHLGAGATMAEIATEWPRWYAANRSAIGDDPDLILPGTVLHPPLER